MKQFFVAVSVILAIALFSCSKPTIIGSDLLDQDRIDLGFTDTITINGYTVKSDSVRTYDPDFANQLIGYLVGNMQDPVFGNTTAKINAQFRPGSEEPDFADAVLDSIVLVLPFDPDGQYGDSLEFYGLDVNLLDEQMDRTVDIYSNKVFATSDLIGVSEQFRPHPYDSLTLQAHGGDVDETFLVVPQIRIRLDDSFGADIMSQDIDVFEDDSLFLATYPGIQISSSTQNAGLNSFNLRTSTAAGVIVYYHVDDDFDEYKFSFDALSARSTSFEHDFSGAVVEDFFDDPALGDSLLFLQGMSGASFIIEIPNTTFLKDKIINRAELELSAITLPDDLFSPFGPVIQVLASEVTDTTLTIIQDVAFGIERGDLGLLFGGILDEDGSPAKFKLNLSAHLRKMSLGLVSNKIQITVLARPELADRIVLTGPGHSIQPAVLKVNFTNL